MANMEVIRELVTKLAFQVDSKGLDAAERKLVGFKTKFAITSAAASAFVQKTVSWFGDVSRVSIETQDLANRAGLALDQFIAIQKALENFNIRPDQFNELFDKLAIDLREARHGFGSLFDLIRRRGDITLKNLDGTLKTTEQLFFDIIDSFGKIENSMERAVYISDYFGKSLGPRLAEAASIGSDGIKSLAQENSALSQELAKNYEDLKSCDRAIIQLNSSWDKFSQTLTRTAAPALTGVLDVLTGVLNGMVNVFSAENMSNVGRVVNSDPNLLDDDDFNYLKSLERVAQEETKPLPIIQQLSNAGAPAQNISYPRIDITNNFDFVVPAGTEENQVRFIESRVRDEISFFFEERIREVINNNPQVE